jgi:hypothetical protein
MWQTHHLYVLKNQWQHPSKCLAECSLHGRHHTFLKYWSLESPLVLNSCPTKKNHQLYDLLPSHYCEMYGFQNADFQLSFTSPSSTQLFIMLPTPVHQTMYDAQTKRLTHTLVQLCGLYTTYTFLKNDVSCRWAAQLPPPPKKKFQPCKPMEASNALTNPIKMLTITHIILFAWYFKESFYIFKTRFRWASNPDQHLSFAMITVHIRAHTLALARAHTHTHTHTHSSTVILSGTLLPMAGLEI